MMLKDLRIETVADVITAPDNTHSPYSTEVFLAGGITNCKDWQKEVIEALREQPITIYNPRQEHFDITDKSASYKQIKWEFDRLEKMDIFSMYFCEGVSDQPICMYELGRNIVRMQNRFPNDWQDRIVVSVEPGYKRLEDVVIQLQLCAPSILVETNATPALHAQRILNAVTKVRENDRD